MTFHVSAPSADHLRGLMAEVGAMLTGRRTFERADGWDGQHPWDVPAFVATHYVPDGWPRPGSTVQFVTDGIESAVARARSAAAPKSVGVHGAQTIQQCLDIPFHTLRASSRKRKLSARSRVRATIWEKTVELSADGTSYRSKDGADAGAPEDDQEATLLYDAMKLAEVAAEHEGQVTARQFAEALGKSKDTAVCRLDALVAEGSATKDESGRTHAWSPAQTAASPHAGAGAAPAAVSGV